MTGAPKGSTISGFMEKSGIEPATPGLQGIGLYPASLACSLRELVNTNLVLSIKYLFVKKSGIFVNAFSTDKPILGNCVIITLNYNVGIALGNPS